VRLPAGTGQVVCVRVRCVCGSGGWRAGQACLRVNRCVWWWWWCGPVAGRWCGQWCVRLVVRVVGNRKMYVRGGPGNNWQFRQVVHLGDAQNVAKNAQPRSAWFAIFIVGMVFLLSGLNRTSAAPVQPALSGVLTFSVSLIGSITVWQANRYVWSCSCGNPTE